MPNKCYICEFYMAYKIYTEKFIVFYLVYLQGTTFGFIVD